jgi:hypothetical protein
MLRDFRKSTIVVACMAVGLVPASGALAVSPEHVYGQVHLTIDKDGSFIDTTSSDVTAGAEAACLIFKRSDCTQNAAAGVALSKEVLPPHEIQDGTHYTGFWTAPAGYALCGAKIEWSKIAIDADSTIAALVVRSTDRGHRPGSSGAKNSIDLDGLAFDVKLAASGQERGVDAIIDLDFVDPMLLNDGINNCQGTGGHPWFCKGPAGGMCIDVRAKE